MASIIREVSDDAYKSMIEDLLKKHSTYEKQFGPAEDLKSYDNLQAKYLALQNAIRRNNPNPIKETTYLSQNTIMEDKFRKVINKLVREEISLMEKKKKKKEEPVDLDLDIDTPTGDENINIDDTAAAPSNDNMDMGMDSGIGMSGETGDGKEIGNHLQAALEAAKNMPDSETKSKLIRQIGNTALFFLKTQIPTGDQG